MTSYAYNLGQLKAAASFGVDDFVSSVKNLTGKTFKKINKKENPLDRPVRWGHRTSPYSNLTGRDYSGIGRDGAAL